MGELTLWTPLFGGMLIGLAASAMLLLNGSITGLSGIVAGVLSPMRNDTLWRLLFLAGLLTGGLLLTVFDPGAFDIGIRRSAGATILAGLLVGFGTRLGNGCTSGHGVCGISRGSIRSIVATLVFMTTGAIVVYVVNHLLGGAV